MSNQKGFTLIEMVVVIVIVAVLAVVAAPRFLNIKSDATEAVIDGIASSFRVVVEQVNYSAIVQGKEHECAVEHRG
ncbi:prepilin-type N-terminal cleavage/methylation domain-containing protein [Vibrio genomosp. F6]|uniref:prepilin-type N-terminal cleavage/methylation domain-containing protein n=1 Tax=Vibrio genomosp. F6 TaxID=723172 RepID=UPI0019CF8B47